ncbi:hypothetical protein B7982_02510 [Fibrobacter sp. UWB2]|uniref:PLAT/LH2 domain-containing protein n=1 Tax=Fibrobacter sp. UWB2 TaxID=1964358 RepID=UPI000B5273DD|nr:PLAT/LH2 domain-containing protein [Fibrobacter sp. UWB2]OWV24602.1 hypothetical protein B7982_02510 [Fibrobacter sp. UWB2]
MATPYRIRIVTGSMKDAGTDAHVFLTAEGTNGSCTWNNLDDKNDKDDFEKGDVNTIDVSANYDLGDIKRITIGHDNKNGHAGWFVSSVSITNVATGKMWTFLTNRWLAKDEADRKLYATFTPSSVTQVTDYRITIFTGEAANGAGTDATVYLRAFGTNGSFYLSDFNDPNDSDDCEAGEVNSVTYTCGLDIGDIGRITIGHNNAKKDAAWFVDGVKIQNLRTGKVWSFPVYSWLAKDKVGAQLEKTVYAGKDMPHYSYLGQYPENRENGWSEEMNGVCHDDSNWYFTQNGNIWKFPVDHDLKLSCGGEDPSRKIYKYHYGYHLGDIDCYNKILFVPVTKNGRPYIVAFDTDNIHKPLAVNEMKLPNGCYFDDIGWLAINPNNGLLFTSNGYILKNNPIYVYSIDFNAIRAGRGDFLKIYTQVNLLDEEGDEFVERECMQGGCFDKSNNLHLCNGYYKNEHSNRKGGITVYEIPELSYNPNKVNYARIRARSNQSHHFRFQFNTYGEEPEGITYWDLDNGKSPNIKGQLHAIMLDNAGRGDDDFYFKHYRKI